MYGFGLPPNSNVERVGQAQVTTKTTKSAKAGILNKFYLHEWLKKDAPTRPPPGWGVSRGELPFSDRPLSVVAV